MQKILPKPRPSLLCFKPSQMQELPNSLSPVHDVTVTVTCLLMSFVCISHASLYITETIHVTASFLSTSLFFACLIIANFLPSFCVYLYLLHLLNQNLVTDITSNTKQSFFSSYRHFHHSSCRALPVLRYSWAILHDVFKTIVLLWKPIVFQLQLQFFLADCVTFSSRLIY